MKKRILSLFLVLLICLSVIPIGTITMSSAEKTPGISEYSVDDDSSDKYPTLMDIRENARRAGRVWADKSVFENSITLDWNSDGIGMVQDNNAGNVYSANGITIVNSSDFLHMFSALGSGLASKNIQALDVVFILDTSASMSSQGELQFIGGADRDSKDYIDRNGDGEYDSFDNRNPRLEHAVDSINDSIDEIMKSSAYNRVALVTFNLGAATVLPLDRYNKTTVSRTSAQSGGLHNGEERYLTIAQVYNNRNGGRTGATYSAATVIPDGAYQDPNDNNYIVVDAKNNDNRFLQQYNSNIESNAVKQRFMDSQGTRDDWKAVEINAVSQTKTGGVKTYIGASSTTGNNGDQHVFWTKDNNNNDLPYLHTSAGTDTYWGIHEGMNLLLNESSTQLTLYKDKAGNLYNSLSEMPPELRPDAAEVPVQRQPIVILITDGAPNPNSSGSKGYSTTLWNYNVSSITTKSQITRYDSANALLVAASASYEKQKVEKKYNNTDLRFYNFGVCMDDMDSSVSNTAHDGQVARVALDPGVLKSTPAGKYAYFDQINTWWSSYNSTTRSSVQLSSETNGANMYTLTHPAVADDISSLEYATKFIPIDEPKLLGTEVRLVLEEWLNPPHRAILGNNDVGVKDTLTYIDPIGKYMEVKDIRYVLLFGTLYNVKKSNIEYVKEIEDASGNKIEVAGTESDYTYTKQYYEIVSKYAYYADGSKTLTVNSSANGAPITNWTIQNPGYSDSDSKHSFSLKDIEIYVKDTGDHQDNMGGGLYADTGSTKQNLYVNIPTAALPIQVATITLDDENAFVGYATNVGLVDKDVDSNGKLTNEYYEKKQHSTPIRVIYEVGVDDAILTEDKKNIDLTKVDAQYLTDNKKDGKVYFYSNWYNSDNDPFAEYVADKDYTYGDAFVSFNSNEENRYYVFEDSRLIFKRTDEGDDIGSIIGLFSDGYYMAAFKTDSSGNYVFDSNGKRILEKTSDTPLERITDFNDFHNDNDNEDGTDYDGNYYVMIEYYDRYGVVQYVLPRKGSEFGYGVSHNLYEHLTWFDPATGNSVNCWEPDKNDPNTGKIIDNPDPSKYYLAAAKGTLRVGDLSAGIGVKDDLTKTETADTYYMPTISSSSDNSMGIIMNLYLGNNGRIAVANTMLLITKQTTNIEGKNRSADGEEFMFTIELDGKKWKDSEDNYIAGREYSVISVIYEGKYNYDVWRTLVQKVELLTGNLGFLWGNDSHRSVYTEDGIDYYIYVGGESGATNLNNGDHVVTYYDNSDPSHDFADMLGGGTLIPIQAWLVPVDKYSEEIENNTWKFTDTLRSADNGMIFKQDFTIGTISPNDIGHAINMTYRSRVTYLNADPLMFTQKDPVNEPGIYTASFKLRDGEGILINGLESDTYYSVTEVLTPSQLSNNIAFHHVDHLMDDDNGQDEAHTHKNILSQSLVSGVDSSTRQDTYTFDNQSHTYNVTGRTNPLFAEEIHYFNYVPNVEKVELEHSADGDYAEIGDTLTYIIDWENYEMDQNAKTYVKANVTVTDKLDPGVTYKNAEFVKAIEDVNGNIASYEAIPEDTWKKAGWSINYNEAEHTVTWKIPNADGGAHGYVRLTVEVTEDADRTWTYESGYGGENAKDFKIINKANVYVNTHNLETEVVETPTWAPEKTETMVNEEFVDVEEDENTGNLVGPSVDTDDEVTYTISYRNITDASADIVIVDKLDPGVEFISAAWNGYTLDADNSVSNTKVKIEYNVLEHRVVWTLFNIAKDSQGLVTLEVKVKKEAIADWHYTDGLKNEAYPDVDFKIFNRASVQIGNNGEQFTKIVENPLPSPYVDLPETGGSGVYMPVMIGAAFVLCAVVLILIQKKRKAEYV